MQVTLSAAGKDDVVKTLKAGTTSVTFDISGLSEVSAPIFPATQDFSMEFRDFLSFFMMFHEK